MPKIFLKGAKCRISKLSKFEFNSRNDCQCVRTRVCVAVCRRQQENVVACTVLAALQQLAGQKAHLADAMADLDHWLRFCPLRSRNGAPVAHCYIHAGTYERQEVLFSNQSFAFPECQLPLGSLDSKNCTRRSLCLRGCDRWPHSTWSGFRQHPTQDSISSELAVKLKVLL